MGSSDYVKDERISEELEKELFRDAYRIAHVGASNPTAVASTMARHSTTLVHLIGTRESEKHPAMQAMAGHLAALYQQGIGPDVDVLDIVQQMADHYGVSV